LTAQQISHTHIPHPIRVADSIAHIVCSADTAFTRPAFFDGPDAAVAVTIFVDIIPLGDKLRLDCLLVVTSGTEDLEPVVANKVVEREFVFDEEEPVTVVDAVSVWDCVDWEFWDDRELMRERVFVIVLDGKANGVGSEKRFEVEAASVDKGFGNETIANGSELLKSKANVAVTRKNVKRKLDFISR